MGHDTSFDPYTKWLGIPDGPRPPDYYVLLGINANETDPNAIRRAADERTKTVRPRCLKYRELGTQLLNEIAKARVCLTDPDRRLAYDESIQDEYTLVAEVPTSIPLRLAIRPRGDLRGHSLPVTCVDFDPQGIFLASAAYDGTSKIWNSSSGELLATFADGGKGTGSPILSETGTPAPLTQAAFSPDGAFFVTAGEATPTKLWDVTKRKLRRVLPHAPPAGTNRNVVTSLAFQPRAPILAVGSKQKPVEVWNVDEGKLIKMVACPTNDLAFSPDGRLLATSQGVWEFDSNRPISRFTRQQAAANCLTFSLDGELLVAGTPAGVMCWETASGEYRSPLGSEKRSVRSVVFSPDGQVIVAGRSDGTLEFWDASTGRFLFQRKAHAGLVNSIAFNPAATILATGSSDRNVRLWELHSGNVSWQSYASDGEGPQLLQPSGEAEGRRSSPSEAGVEPKVSSGGDAKGNLPDGRQLPPAVRAVDELLRSWAGEGNPILHNFFRVLVIPSFFFGCYLISTLFTHLILRNQSIVPYLGDLLIFFVIVGVFVVIAFVRDRMSR